MNNYQKSLIEEHSQLTVRVQKLNDYVHGDGSANDNKVEFANKCLQLAAMKKYEECLLARLENTGVIFEEGNYFERVATINQPVPTTENCCGSDYDVDSDKCEPKCHE